jgi:hypothetical protein
MSTYEDNLLAARFAALAPEPLAGNWDEVLDRAGAARKGRPERSRVFQGRRRRLLVVLAAVALVAVATASAFAVRAFVIDKGFVGLPPEGATPSTPVSGELVIALLAPAVGDWGKSWFWLYADGRLISDREANLQAGANEFSSGYLEQRLPPESVEQLRSEVVSAAKAGGPEVPFYSVLLAREGDRLVSVEQTSGLAQLTARLTDPASWLPPSAGEGLEIRAYVPSRYAVCYGAWPPDRSLQPARILTLLPAAAQDVLRARDSRQRARTDDSGVLGYDACSEMTTEEARVLAETLDDAGFERGGAHYDISSPNLDDRASSSVGWEGNYGLAYLFDTPGPAQGHVHFHAILPHGEYWVGR